MKKTVIILASIFLFFWVKISHGATYEVGTTNKYGNAVFRNLGFSGSLGNVETGLVVENGARFGYPYANVKKNNGIDVQSFFGGSYFFTTDGNSGKIILNIEGKRIKVLYIVDIGHTNCNDTAVHRILIYDKKYNTFSSYSTSISGCSSIPILVQGDTLYWGNSVVGYYFYDINPEFGTGIKSLNLQSGQIFNGYSILLINNGVNHSYKNNYWIDNNSIFYVENDKLYGIQWILDNSGYIKSTNNYPLSNINSQICDSSLHYTYTEYQCGGSKFHHWLFRYNGYIYINYAIVPYNIITTYTNTNVEFYIKKFNLNTLVEESTSTGTILYGYNAYMNGGWLMNKDKFLQYEPTLWYGDIGYIGEPNKDANGDIIYNSGGTIDYIPYFTSKNDGKIYKIIGDDNGLTSTGTTNTGTNNTGTTNTGTTNTGTTSDSWFSWIGNPFEGLFDKLTGVGDTTDTIGKIGEVSTGITQIGDTLSDFGSGTVNDKLTIKTGSQLGLNQTELDLISKFNINNNNDGKISNIFFYFFKYMVYFLIVFVFIVLIVYLIYNK